MLLKGMHDDVKISIVEEKSTDEEKKTEKVESDEPPKDESKSDEPKPTTEETAADASATKPSKSQNKHPSSVPKQSSKDEHEASSIRQSPQRFTFDSVRLTPTNSPVVTRRKSNVYSSPLRKDVTSSPLQTRSPFLKRQKSDASLSPFRPPSQHSSPTIPRRPNHDGSEASSDGETEMFTATRKYLPPPPLMSCSDSEADGRISVTPRRGRVKLPPVFLAQSSSTDISGRPPAPWRMRKAKSSMNVTKTSPDVSVSTRRKSIGAVPTNKPLARKKEPVIDKKGGERVLQNTKMSPARKEPNHVVSKNDDKEVVKEDTVMEEPPVSPPNTKENDAPPEPVRPKPLKCKSAILSREASMRVDHEVHQLMKDIRRVGSNPGEPSVTFGELFDDETVQDTYEALVGTLRSAKRQGYIDFKGQMLFKGVHDDVTINVVEKKMKAVGVA